MATFDDIMGGYGFPAQAPGTDATKLVGKPGMPPAQPALKPAATPPVPAPGTDATKIVGSPGTVPQSIVKPRQMSYVELYEAMNPNKPETAEERAKREKREKREAILSAVGDGISALSNLFFTTQYAPSAYDASKGMSAKTRERWDRLRAEREANSRAYNDGYLRALAMDEARDREDKNWRHMLEREKISDNREEMAQKRAERKEEQNEQMFQARIALQYGKLTEQGYRNRIAEIKAGKAEELTDAQINRLNRMGSNSGNGRGAGSFPWYDRDGNVHYAKTYKEALYNAAQNGTWEQFYEETETETVRNKGTRLEETSTTTALRPSSGASFKPKKKETDKSEKKGDGKWENTSKLNWK